jgi:hypothetical protein
MPRERGRVPHRRRLVRFLREGELWGQSTLGHLITALNGLKRIPLIWKVIYVLFSLLREERKDSTREEQLVVLGHQGEEDCANTLRNPQVSRWDGRSSSEIVAHREIGGRGELGEVAREEER